MAIGLVEAALSSTGDTNGDKISIVGWYTAPMLRQDSHPGPVAVRIRQGLSQPSCLIVIQNDSLMKKTQESSNADGESPTIPLSHCFQNYSSSTESQPVQISDATPTEKVLQEAVTLHQEQLTGVRAGSMLLHDFLDHLEPSPHFSRFNDTLDPAPWYPAGASPAIEELVRRMLG
jgi:Uncharacterised protein family (UPF0172)